MTETKYLENPAQVLAETGLLFHINRTLLHPLGLSLEVVIEETPTGPLISDKAHVRLAHSSAETGFRFTLADFQEGHKQFERYMKMQGKKKVLRRANKIGYIIQPNPVSEEEVE